MSWKRDQYYYQIRIDMLILLKNQTIYMSPTMLSKITNRKLAAA